MINELIKKTEKRAEKIEEVKSFFYETTLDACAAHYERLINATKTLESKAQTTIAIAGIFIAAMFAFIRDLNALKLTQEGKSLLVITIVLLVLSVFFSILVLLLRTTLQPLTGDQTYAIIKDLITLNPSFTDFSDEKIDFIEQQIIMWEKPVESVEKSNLWKVRFLWVSHIFLLLVIILVGILTLGIILGNLREV